MRADPLTDPDPKVLAGGEPLGCSNFAAPAMARSMRRANRKNLELRTDILE